LILISITGCSSFLKSQTKETYSYNSLISSSQAQAISNKYFVNTSEPNNKDNHQEEWLNKKILDDFEQLDETEKMVFRNDMIDELIILSDYSFNEYKTIVYTSKKAFDFSVDTYSLLLTGTASLATGGSTANILSGVATLVTGVRSSFNETVLSENTVDLIVTTMEGNRLTGKVLILKSKDLDINKYSLRTALRDILEMHQQGNIVVALTSLKNYSSKRHIKAEDDIQKFYEDKVSTPNPQFE
ncbi:hypothetical protein, partial [Shewanella sp. 10N.286.51.B7]|uniref:hypothetical protein n=1 Tax=Shewanella sp. 10N.286.51.B7 TaxID=1880836 RepID=UPI0012FFDE83